MINLCDEKINFGFIWWEKVNPESSSEVKEAREIVEGSFDVKLINISSKAYHSKRDTVIIKQFGKLKKTIGEKSRKLLIKPN